MASNSETGHAVNVQHFFEIKTIILGLGAKYAPGNPLIRQEALETLYLNGKSANDAIATPMSLWKNKVVARQQLMVPLNKLITRIIRALKAGGADEATINQANEFVRKIRGAKAARAKPAEGEEKQNGSSSSQLSVAQRISNFHNLIELLANVPAYLPGATDIQLSALQSLHAEMETVNNDVITSEIPLTAARQIRDATLYTPKTGLTAVAQMVKDEVASVFGFGSPEHKQVRRLKFTSPN